MATIKTKQKKHRKPTGGKSGEGDIAAILVITGKSKRKGENFFDFSPILVSEFEFEAGGPRGIPAYGIAHYVLIPGKKKSRIQIAFYKSGKKPEAMFKEEEEEGEEEELSEE